MRARRLALPVLALTLALPAAAPASVPAPDSHLIVPGKTIGGVTLGHSARSAKSAWGSFGECITSPTFTSCRYRVSKTKSLGEAQFSADNGKVSSMSLQSGTSSTGGAIVPRSFKRYKTSKGIGVGSTVAAIKSAYPRAKREGSPSILYYTLAGPGKASTLFQIKSGKAISVIIRDGTHQG